MHLTEVLLRALMKTNEQRKPNTTFHWEMGSFAHKAILFLHFILFFTDGYAI